MRLIRGVERGDFLCNVCSSTLAHFYGEGRALCPVCGEAERERLLFWVLTNAVELDGKRVLGTSQGPFAQLAMLNCYKYVSTSHEASALYAQSADLCALPFASESFDAVVSIHVLEHVPDDERAIAEIHRILVRGGLVLLAVPEDPSMPHTDRTDPGIPSERVRRFGHPDHKRQYGADVPQFLERHGFSTRTYTPCDVPDDLCKRLALLKSDRIHVGCKM
ncbi:MAG TPA: class I SAM-dependent methyltransferase [Steroidobacteraceae bacterium]|nr:class I SAM-dependent methyltransferase [Steroidobacteraceae bacterium]